MSHAKFQVMFTSLAHVGSCICLAYQVREFHAIIYRYAHTHAHARKFLLSMFECPVIDRRSRTIRMTGAIPYPSVVVGRERKRTKEREQVTQQSSTHAFWLKKTTSKSLGCHLANFQSSTSVIDLGCAEVVGGYDSIEFVTAAVSKALPPALRHTSCREFIQWK